MCHRAGYGTQKEVKERKTSILAAIVYYINKCLYGKINIRNMNFGVGRPERRNETGDGDILYCMSAICQEFGSGGRRDEVNATERQGKCQSTSQRGAKEGGWGGGYRRK
jgi:hypothetical protein